MSKLLFDEQPLIVSRELAKITGLNEAIVLQQIHYWLEINRKANKNFYSGRYWTYNSMKNWHENDFSFWSFDTVKRTFTSLERKGYIVSGNFNRQKFDQTKWYSIDYEALETLNLPIRAKCPNGEGQFAPMENGILPQPIPEINTENKTPENIQSNPIQSVYAQNKEHKTDKIGLDTISEQSFVAGRTHKKESLPNVSTDQSETFTKPSYETIKDIIKQNIEFDYIAEEKTVSQETLNEIVHVITSTVCADYKDGSISMGEEKVPAGAVKSVFLKLGREDIEYFVECFDRQTAPITKLTPYIRASLYRNYGTIDHYWKNRVHVDMPSLAGRKIQSKK